MDVDSLKECSICGETVAEEETTMAFGDVVCDRCNAKYNRAKAQQALINREAMMTCDLKDYQ